MNKIQTEQLPRTEKKEDSTIIYCHARLVNGDSQLKPETDLLKMFSPGTKVKVTIYLSGEEFEMF